MGLHLVTAALHPHYSGLSSTGFRVLVAMCAAAIDREATTRNGTPPGEYWGGHDRLMLAVIGDIPAHDSTEYLLAKRRISRAIAELVDAGAVERIVAGGRARAARYRLTVGTPADPAWHT